MALVAQRVRLEALYFTVVESASRLSANNTHHARSRRPKTSACTRPERRVHSSEAARPQPMPSPVANRALSEAAHPNAQIKSESDKALGKRKASAAPVAGDSDIDSECMEVDNPYTSGAPSTATSDTRDDEVCQVVDEDCIITGRSGSLALSDVRLRLEPGHSQARRGRFH